VVSNPGFSSGAGHRGRCCNGGQSIAGGYGYEIFPASAGGNQCGQQHHHHLALLIVFVVPFPGRICMKGWSVTVSDCWAVPIGALAHLTIHVIPRGWPNSVDDPDWFDSR